VSRAIATVLACALSVLMVGIAKPRFSEIPDGLLSGGTYTNEGLGVKFHVPDGWTATTDGEIPDGFDYHPPQDPSRQCVKVLMSISVSGSSADPEYTSKGSYFVIDPGCFPDARFPKSMDTGDIRAIAGKIIHAFAHSPYIAPDGADVGAFQQESLLFVMLTGQCAASASNKGVHENIMLSFTAFNGYWVGWATRADDERTEQLKSTSNGLQFWIGPKGKMP
jgi:hypothetical protein